MGLVNLWGVQLRPCVQLHRNVQHHVAAYCQWVVGEDCQSGFVQAFKDGISWSHTEKAIWRDHCEDIRRWKVSGRAKVTSHSTNGEEYQLVAGNTGYSIWTGYEGTDDCLGCLPREYQISLLINLIFISIIYWQ